MNVQVTDLAPLLSAGILLVTAVLLLMYEVFSQQTTRTYAANIAVLGFGLGIWALVSDFEAPTRYLFGASDEVAPLIADKFSRVASVLLMAGGLVAALMSPAYARNAGHDHGEYYALMIFAVLGMVVMVMSGDLITFFLGLETMSVAVYALAGLRREDPRSSEAALKYFLIGSFATGFLLFGIALVYGSVGAVNLTALSREVTREALMAQPLMTLGVVMILIGFAFKVAAVPFHMWAPDVYEGAPTPVTGFMAVGVKAAAFVALLRFVAVGLTSNDPNDSSQVVLWSNLLSGLAVATIIVGNVMALAQNSIKRMLAYSSVSHAGYLLIGIVAVAKGEDSAGSAVIFYLASYTFMTLGAFGVLTFLERKEGGAEAERFGAYAGIGFKHPALGLAMSLFMIALAGMPPTGGFFGKMYLFTAAIRANELNLALVGILGSIISVYYYLRVIVAFYMREVPEPGPTPTATPSSQLTLGLALSVAAVLVLGVFPSHWVELSRSAFHSLGF